MKDGILVGTLIVRAQNDAQARDIVLYGVPGEIEILDIKKLSPHIFEVSVEFQKEEE